MKGNFWSGRLWGLRDPYKKIFDHGMTRKSTEKENKEEEFSRKGAKAQREISHEHFESVYQDWDDRHGVDRG